jgi:hypothetical protein
MKIFSPTITGSLGVLGNTILDGNLNVTGGITGSTVYSPSGSFLNLTAVSASFGYLRTVTGSAVIIGDEFIILNADTPVARYAGLIVYDSGSGSPATASFEWDGLTDNWIIQEETGKTAVVLTGPTGSRGSEVLPTTNVLQKGGGQHQLVDSSITDNGTTITGNTSIQLTGANSSLTGSLRGLATDANNIQISSNNPGATSTSIVLVSGQSTGYLTPFIDTGLSFNAVTNTLTTTTFIGDLTGTASFATSASFATTASFATSASFATTAATASFIAGVALVGSANTFTANNVFSGSVRGEVNALSISSNTASLDCALDNFFTLQLVSGSNTFINPSNILPGQTINLRVNTTGSATVSFPSSVKQVSGSAYVPTTTTGVDVVTFISFDATSLLLSNVKNLV